MNEESAICHYCINEEYVKSYIKAKGGTNLQCSYCRKRRKSVELSKIADMMHEVFETYYEMENSSFDFGMEGDSAQEVISMELDVKESIAEDIYELLCEEHNPVHANEGLVYSEDYIYTGRPLSTERLNQAWDRVKKSLNSKARFFNREVKEFLDELFSDLHAFQSKGDVSPIKILTTDFRMYRARYFDSLKKVETELQHPERNFGPPPSELARSGRMNAHGISVFYGATTPDIAIAEIRPPVGSHVIVAPFRPLKGLNILDISALDSLIYKKQSFFDPETIKSLERTAFLKTFSKKMTLPVFDNQLDNGYLITQAISEYLSVSDKYKLDGISFQSTQVRKRKKKRDGKPNMTSEGYNIVLFSKASGVRESDLGSRSYKVTMSENVEDEYEIFSPKIRLIESEPNYETTWKVLPIPALSDESSLELLAAEITHYKIEGVLFQKEMTEVVLGTSIKQRGQQIKKSFLKEPR